MWNKYFTGQRKFFTWAAVSVFLILLTGLISPFIVRDIQYEWTEEREEFLGNTSAGVRAYFDELSGDILNTLSESLDKIHLDAVENDRILFTPGEHITDEDTDLVLYDQNGRREAWTGRVIPFADSLRFVTYKPGEVFFIDEELRVFIGSYDTLSFKGDDYFLLAYRLVHKKYRLNNSYYREKDLLAELTDRFLTSFRLDFLPNKQIPRQRGFHTLAIRNNMGRDILYVSFEIPARNESVSRTRDIFSTIQGSMVILAFIFLGMGLYKDLVHVDSRLLRFFLIGVYLAVLRVLLFIFGIPSRFIEGSITDPSYFSTIFASGIVRSPLEFFITISVFLSLAIVGYRYFFEYTKRRTPGFNRNRLRFYSLAIIFTAVSLISFRGYASAIKSIIFDSSLRYFKEIILLPDFPSTLMHLNTFMLGLCSVLFAVIFISVILVNIPYKKNKKQAVIIIFVIFQIVAYLYDFTHRQPEGTPPIRFVFFTVVFLLSYYLVFNNFRSRLSILYYLFTGSVISVSLLSHYNSRLERESIKTTAIELTRTNENLVEFMVNDALAAAAYSETSKNVFTSEIPDYTEAGFKLWSKSLLQREDLGSELSFLNADLEYLGGFNILPDNYPPGNWKNIKPDTSGIKIFREENIFGTSKIIRGITPVRGNDGVILGYVEVSVLYEQNTFAFEEVPEFLSTRKSNLNPTVDFDKLKIFDFHNGELVNSYSDFFLSPTEKEILSGAEFNDLNEKWLHTFLNHESYLVYALNIKQEGLNRVVAVALMEKDISWSLFDFFKVFFVHSIFIIILLVGYFFFELLRHREIKLTFRTQLLVAFLVISIIPLILLAIYFRNLTEEKNTDAIYYKLGKRAVSVEQYINEHLSSSTVNRDMLYEKAAHDLDINFTVFEKNTLVYSSRKTYYSIGLMNEILDPDVNHYLVKQGLKEYVVDEKIENYETSSLYYKANIGGEEYIIKVSKVFNPILLPFAGIEVDIFLFGSYSLAVVLIIIISTILANQISSPIRKLTMATRSVSGGDLSFTIGQTYKGEMQELVDGFNSMVRRLKKSQSELAEIERELAWKEMARQVAHEIKNPLTPMKLAIQQLAAAYHDKSPKFDDIFEKVTHTVINQIETLKNIATEFSAFARMPRLKLEKFELLHVLRESVNLFSEENVKVELIAAEPAIEVEADSDQMQRLLINMIRNSVQAGASEITVKAEQKAGNCYIRVADNGSGIPSEIVQRIFDDNFTTKLRGMGIGLSLAKRFMEGLHGSITVESTSPEGSVLLLTFPVTQENIHPGKP